MMGKNKCEPWNQFGVVFKLEDNKSSYCKCLACHKSKGMYGYMLCIIQNGISYGIIQRTLAQYNYTE